MAFDPSTAQLAPDDERMSSGDDEGRRKQTAFERNRGWTRPGPRQFTTSLQPDEEAKFQAWVKASKAPFDPGQQADFDMRGFWKTSQDPAEWKRLQQAGKIPSDMEPAGTKIDPNDGKPHFPDYWKTPYHETFSNESQWATEKAPKWNEKDQLVTPDGKVLFDDKAQNKPAEPAKSKFDQSTATLWEEPSKPEKKAAFDHQSAVPESALSHIVKAGLAGYKEGFENTPRLISPEIQTSLNRIQESGGIKGYLAALASTALEDIHAPLAVGPGLFRGAQGAIAQAGEELGDHPNVPFGLGNMPLLARDIAAAPEAFMGMPSALRARPGEPAAPARPRMEPGFPEPPAGPVPQLSGPPGPPGEPPPAAPPGAPLQIAGPREPAPLVPGEPPAAQTPTGGLPEAKAKIQQGVTLAQRYADEIQQLRTQGATPEMLAPAIQRNREHLQQLQSYAEQVRDMERTAAPTAAAAPTAEPDWYRSYLDGIRSLVPADANPWAPVAEAPADQPHAETPIAAPAPTEAAPAAAPATEAPEPVAPTAAQPPSVGTFQDMRTAGYDKNPDHPLAGRIEHLKELAQSPNLLPREQRELERRVRHFEQFNQLVADLPVEQRAMARSLRPDDIIQGKDKDGRTIVGRVEGFDRTGIMSVQDANGLDHQVHVSTLEDVQHVARGGQPIPVVPPSDQKRDEVPSPEAPSPEATPKGEAITVPPSPPTDTAYGGPWTRVKTKDGEDASNRQGEPLYENPNGARATFDNGVPHTESVIEHPEKGLVPRNVVDRRGQFLTAEETGLGAAPPKPKSESLPKTGGEAGKSKPKSAEKPVMESGGSSEWKYFADNEEGDPIYTNDQGVHSIVKDGVRIVEKVRLRPTKAGMAMSVPPPMEKEPAFRPALAEKPKPEAPTDSTPAEKPSTDVAKPVEPKTATVADMPKPPTADLKGIPKTAYRGTGRADVASAYNGVAEPIAGPGRYSAFSKTDAEKFGPNVEEAPIDLKNPLVIRSDDQWRALTKEAGWEFPNPSFGMTADKMKAAAAKLKEVVQGKGHDGIIAWWNNDTPYDVDEQGRPIKTLRNALGVPQVIDYREPEAAKERYPYNISKYTDPTSIEADRIAVDARNGEMPKEVAVDILAAMTARGDIPEPFAKLMLNKMQVDYDGPLWNNALAGFQARQEAIRTNQPAPKAEEPQTVTHVTKKGKTLTGTIRKDLTLDEAKALDPYAFKKDGGYFIRAPKEEKAKPAGQDVSGLPPEQSTAAPEPYWMNEPEIDDAIAKLGDHPGLGDVVKFLGAYRDMINENSDGWPYWGAEAAKPLMGLIHAAMDWRAKRIPTQDEIKRALTPIKSFITKRNLPQPAYPMPEITRGGSTILKPKPRPVESGGHPSAYDWSQMIADIFKEKGAQAAKEMFEALATANDLSFAQRQNLSAYTRAAMGAAGWQGGENEGPPGQTLPAVTQTAADQAAPEPMTPLPPEPAPADAISLAQGKGPVPVTVEPDPTDKIKPKTRDITDADLAAATDMLEDRDEQPQIDRILDMLAKGWSRIDISEAPGIDLTPHEIEALQLASVMDAEERGLVRPEKGTNDGLQSTIRLGDAGEGSEGVSEPGPVGEDRGASAGEESGGAPDAEGAAGTGTQGQTRRTNRSGGGGGGRTRTRNPDRLPDTGEGSDTRDAGRPPQAPDTIEGTNFVIEPGILGEARGRALKARDNVAAIELAKRLTAETRLATRAEQEVLVKYVGWGGLKNAFRDSTGQLGKGMEDVGARLEQILTPEEYRTAERSTQYAHYTAEHVIRSMWDAVRGMGFAGGSVFEPGMGIGHFLGLMPPDLAQKSRYRGIEMDHLTTDIAKLLYPRSGIQQADFTRMALPEQAFDLVIGNPPFSDAVISSDRKYSANRFMLHDYFFAKSLDAVRPGGLLAFVTSAGTMNKMEPKAREYLAERSEFLGGVRLPSSAFRQNAGTDVTTDVLFFKRRPEGKVTLMSRAEPELAWTQVVPRALPNAEGGTTEGNVNRYFSDHPEMVLGEEGFFDKLYKDRYAVHQTPGTDLPTDLRVAIDRLPKNVMEPEPTPEQKAALDFSSAEKKDGSFYLKDGTLMQYRGGAGREVLARGKGVEGGFTTADRDRVIKLIPVRDALREVFAADLARDDATGATARQALNRAYDDFVKWFGPINKGEISYKRPSIIQQESARDEAREEARFVGDPFQEGTFDATPMQDAKAKVGEIARAREAARQAALTAGTPFNEGTFDPADMPDIVIEKRPNIRPFMSDPESYRLRSIENYDDSTNTATKKPIFTRSILTYEEEPKINSAHDGVLWSLNKLGRFDVPAIAEKMGKEPRAVVEELGDDVFKVPGTEDTYQTKDEYLSGDVVTKLEQAREAAERDPDVRRNIAALEAAAPRPLAPSRISMVIGMPWIPPRIVSEFVRDHLQLGEPRITYSQVTGTWIVGTGRQRDAAGIHQWGTSRRSAYELLSDALNRTPPRVMTPGSHENPPVFDPVATQAAQDKMGELRDAFYDPETRSGWVLQDQARANELADLYNAKLNREVLRQFDGSYLTTPGVADSWSWRPHQTRVVSRIILEGNTYMAHAVGAGKTSAMIGAGMEMKRLGLVRKPMYAVPNHMLGQFSKEFYEQYPTARIAIADEERFHTDRRKQFIANVAQDDLDAVIITHSSFQKVPISDEFQADLIQEQIDMLTEAMSQLDKQADRITVGRMQKQREKLEQRLSKASGTEKDQTLTFEEMGVDFLFVDEAHQFRKLSFATKQGQMKGISPEGSNMAWDLFTKVRYLDSQRPGRSVVFASGTPITNTMGELYSLSRYMQPQAMKERGIEHFDSWAQTFGTTKTTLEETAAGTYQPVTRFGKFVNMPELYKMVGGVMDIVTPGQLEQYVTRPKLKGGERQFHMAPRTEILDRYQAGLGARMEAIKARRGPPQKGDDILLSVINDGRHAAIDPRFVEESQSDPSSKLNILVDNVARIYHETRDVQFYDPGTAYEKPSFRGPATQMVFANLGVNGRGPMGFSSYRWIKEGLRRAGVPQEQIAFIGDYGSTIARQKLFNDMNEGKVSVLIGSTQKMGTGVNAQRRLIAVHNQDPLWFPADDEQRNGRILRQGNHNPEIEIHDYTTKGTYDSAMWQMMAKKAGFIEQFFRGDPTLRDMEDIGEASMYEQASAMSTTDERILTLTQLKQDLDKARRRQSAHEDEQWALRSKHQQHLSSAGYYTQSAAAYANDIKQRVDTSGKNFSMMVAGETFTKRPEALDALKATIEDRLATMGERSSNIIGNIGGFRIRLNKGKQGQYDMDLMLTGDRTRDLSKYDSIASAETMLRNFEEWRNDGLRNAAKEREDAASIEPYLGKPFEGGAEIRRLDEAVRELEATLRAEAKRAEGGGKPDDAESDQSATPPEGNQGTD